MVSQLTQEVSDMGDWYSFEIDRKRSEVQEKPSLRARLAKLLAEDPDDCECEVCVKDWEDYR
jgi:hypothetical protein